MYRFSAGREVIDIISSRIRNNVLSVKYGAVQFKFSAPNSFCYYRAETFTSKEPKTLEWITKFKPGSKLWNVGANIGLYSLYASKVKDVNVFAIEPSIFNLEFLVRNVNTNKLNDKVVILPITLAEKTQYNMMRMRSTKWSGALSSFEKILDGTANRLTQCLIIRFLALP